MQRVIQLFVVFALLLPGLVLIVSPNAGQAHSPANRAFEDTWDRTDKPVVDGLANRTWMWGLAINFEVLHRAIPK